MGTSLYLDFNTSRHHNRSERERVRTDGCDEDARYVGVNHGGTCCHRVSSAASGGGDDEPCQR